MFLHEASFFVFCVHSEILPVWLIDALQQLRSYAIFFLNVFAEALGHFPAARYY